MKRIAILAIALPLIAGCNKIFFDKSAEEDFVYSFVCEMEDDYAKSMLGSTCVQWTSGDKIGTYAGGLNNNGGAVTLGDPCSFEVRTNTALTPGSMVYAYAPYSSTAGTSPSSVKVAVPPVQKMNDGVFCSDALPLAARPYTVPAGGLSNTSIRFRNLGSLVELRIYTGGLVGVSETVKSVSFTSASDICGDYTVDLTSDDRPQLNLVNGCKKATTMLEGTPLVLGSNGYSSCFIALAPGSYSGTFEVLTDKAVYTMDSPVLQ